MSALALTLAMISCQSDSDIPEEAFVVLIDAAPLNLDPRFAQSDYGVKISRLIFSRLVTTDNADGRPELDLAVEIRNPTPTVYVVDLRRDARFHDGHAVTAEDVVYTFSTLAEVGAPGAREFEGVEIEALDDYAVRFTLPEPRATFAMDLQMGIVPAHILSQLPEGRFGDEPLVGSGPFRFRSRDGQQLIVVDSNEDYYGGSPEIETIAFRLIRDDNARLISALAGSADMLQNAISPMMLPVIDDYSHLTVESGPSFKYTYIVFNFRHELLSDVRVRQAISYAIDREEIVAQKFGGRAILASGMLAPDHWGYEPEQRRYPYDPARAEALLDEAGYPRGPDGEPRFRLEFKVSANRFRRSVAYLIAHQLGAVGIEVEVRAYEWGTFFGDVRSGNFEMASLQWVGIVDPDLYRIVFHSSAIPWLGGSGANRGGYVSSQVDRLVDEGRRTLDLASRAELYREVQRILAEDVPYVSLWHEDNFVVANTALENYELVPSARFRYLTDAIWRPDRAEAP